MPELPEVESVRRGLAPWVTGARIDAVRVLDPRILGTTSQRSIAAEAVSSLVGSLTGVRLGVPARRGKFLWIPTLPGDGPDACVSLHLGMSGQLRIHTADEPLHRHTRAVLDLRSPAGEERELRFLDQRIFGHLGLDPLVVDDGDAIPAPIAHIARDLLDPRIDEEAVVARLRRSRSAIKAALLDQTVVSGIGNIYADEALHAAGVHPTAQPSRLRPHRLRRVLEESRRVMEAALAQGGTSFDALYVHVNGESGYFERSLRVYGRTGQPCTACGEPIRRTVVGGRSTHFCPSCQKPQRRPRPA